MTTFENWAWKDHEEGKRLSRWIDIIKKECRIDGIYFSFFEVPDLLVKKKVTGADMTNVVNILKDAKDEFVVDKSKALEMELDKVKVTEEDKAPF